MPCYQYFLEKVIDWWNRKRSEKINPNPMEALYGYNPESNRFHTFNHYPLIVRYYVHLTRNKFETPELQVFIVLLENPVRKKKLQKQTEISSNTEIVDHPVHF